MKWSSVIALALSATSVHAMLRFSCSQLVVDRLDPLVNPGAVGSLICTRLLEECNAFNTSMHPENDLPAFSTCTSCTFSEDFSNHCTAALYFRARNGTFKRVPLMGN
ncbi:uncharacterized protein BP5553_06625 [Venustampulla echinocandica]|uniref:DUF1996 domain-containing protein n=1 Tax=Venustampulla echinocandica TaxID=2656787 RepID=A0A370TKG7_9HELO|nr:uncharacterized protein BP5553_06625 [Venustampulla echinocandica]RDL36013.1 hypothetical protein BP5553_06625 [Venustampulla echinocandica]